MRGTSAPSIDWPAAQAGHDGAPAPDAVRRAGERGSEKLDDELSIVDANISRFLVARPLNTFSATTRIAAAVVEAGGYPALI
jgi:hypothetical protein